ncbi:unnamed protein product [Amoebophrya sp. A120]|nr:unnamed protein product [Amoebophrya sp. A120]|eukprot:GSA120T00002194001.1
MSTIPGDGRQHQHDLAGDPPTHISAFSLVVLFALWVFAHAWGCLFRYVMKTPPLLGYLLGGICFRNVGGAALHFAQAKVRQSLIHDNSRTTTKPGGPPAAGDAEQASQNLTLIPADISSLVRTLGLATILMIAGCEIDYQKIRRMGGMCLRLTVLPGVSEAFAVALVSMYVFGFSLAWGLVLGFILGAVSPAVVCGGMFALQKRGYGVAKAIPSLVVCAASLDDVVAISGFTTSLGVAMSDIMPADERNLLRTLLGLPHVPAHPSSHFYAMLHGPTNLLLGAVLGVTLGAAFAKLCQTDAATASSSSSRGGHATSSSTSSFWGSGSFFGRKLLAAHALARRNELLQSSSSRGRRGRKKLLPNMVGKLISNQSDSYDQGSVFGGGLGDDLRRSKTPVEQLALGSARESRQKMRFIPTASSPATSPTGMETQLPGSGRGAAEDPNSLEESSRITTEVVNNPTKPENFLSAMVFATGCGVAMLAVHFQYSGAGFLACLFFTCAFSQLSRPKSATLHGTTSSKTPVGTSTGDFPDDGAEATDRHDEGATGAYSDSGADSDDNRIAMPSQSPTDGGSGTKRVMSFELEDISLAAPSAASDEASHSLDLDLRTSSPKGAARGGFGTEEKDLRVVLGDTTAVPSRQGEDHSVFDVMGASHAAEDADADFSVRELMLAAGAQDYTPVTAVCHNLSRIWDWFAEPLLFGVIGTVVDVRKLHFPTLPKATFLVLCCVFFVRVPAAVFATSFGNLSWRERIFIGLAWMPKATVQAALGSVPLDRLHKILETERSQGGGKNSSTPEVEMKVLQEWGEVIVTTAVLSILLTAPIGLLVVSKLGPIMLTRDGDPSASRRTSGADHGAVELSYADNVEVDATAASSSDAIARE